MGRRERQRSADIHAQAHRQVCTLLSRRQAAGHWQQRQNASRFRPGKTRNWYVAEHLKCYHNFTVILCEYFLFSLIVVHVLVSLNVQHCKIKR